VAKFFEGLQGIGSRKPFSTRSKFQRLKELYRVCRGLQTARLPNSALSVMMSSKFHRSMTYKGRLANAYGLIEHLVVILKHPCFSQQRIALKIGAIITSILSFANASESDSSIRIDSIHHSNWFRISTPSSTFIILHCFLILYTAPHIGPHQPSCLPNIKETGSHRNILLHVII
jgi:hypothetical protein